MPEVILRPDETWRRCGISRSMLFALVKSGEFPKPIRLTSRTVGFVEREVDGWIRDRIQQSRGDAADAT